jgi:hypothetical protein
VRALGRSVALRYGVAAIILPLAPLALAARGIPTVAAPAAPTPPPHQRVTYTYKTFLDRGSYDYWEIHKFDVDFGTITLTFEPDATIHGTYRPDNTPPTAVSGRVTGGGKLRLVIGGERYTGRFTPRGFAVASAPAGQRWTLWGQFAHPEHPAV